MSKRIAFSFDDAPNSDDPYLSGERRTARLIGDIDRDFARAAVW